MLALCIYKKKTKRKGEKTPFQIHLNKSIIFYTLFDSIRKTYF